MFVEGHCDPKYIQNQQKQDQYELSNLVELFRGRVFENSFQPHLKGLLAMDAFDVDLFVLEFWLEAGYEAGLVAEVVALA